MSALGRKAEVSRAVLLIPFQFPQRRVHPYQSGVSLMSLNEKRSRSSVSLRAANKTRSPFAQHTRYGVLVRLRLQKQWTSDGPSWSAHGPLHRSILLLSAVSSRIQTTSNSNIGRQRIHREPQRWLIGQGRRLMLAGLFTIRGPVF